MSALRNYSSVNMFKSKDVNSDEENPNNHEDSYKTTSKVNDEDMVGGLQISSKRK